MNKIESFFSVLSPTTHLSHYQMTFSLFVFIGFLEVQRFFLEKRKWFKSTFNLITLSRWMCAFVSVRATHACANMHHVTYRHRKHLSVLRDAQALSCCNKQETDTRQRYFSSIGQNTSYSRCGLSFLFHITPMKQDHTKSTAKNERNQTTTLTHPRPQPDT